VSSMIILPDGSLQIGENVIAPWPSLAMTPQRSMEDTEMIVWSHTDDAVWPFTAQIPGEVRALVQALPARNFQVLEFAASAPTHAIEILRQCPALAVLLVGRYSPILGPRREFFRKVAIGSWLDALATLGLPRQRSTLRMLMKVPARHCELFSLRRFTDAVQMQHPHLRILRHLPRISRDTIALLGQPPDRVNAHLFRASCDSDYDEEPIKTCVESVGAFREQERPGGRWPYAHLNAVMLAGVEAEFRRRAGELLYDGTPFPSPPFPGVPGRITPLASFASVATEGDTQQNCSISLVPEIIHGTHYIYTVTVRERATLAIRRSSDRHHWVVEDLRGFRNSAPSHASKIFVANWLSEHGATPPDS